LYPVLCAYSIFGGLKYALVGFLQMTGKEKDPGLNQKPEFLA